MLLSWYFKYVGQTSSSLFFFFFFEEFQYLHSSSIRNQVNSCSFLPITDLADKSYSDAKRAALIPKLLDASVNRRSHSSHSTQLNGRVKPSLSLSNKSWTTGQQRTLGGVSFFFFFFLFECQISQEVSDKDLFFWFYVSWIVKILENVLK